MFQEISQESSGLVQGEERGEESALLNVEVLLKPLDPVKLGIDVASLQTRCNDTLAILCQENVWICDTCVSTHVTLGNKVTNSMQKTKINSLGMQAWQWSLLP